MARDRKRVRFRIASLMGLIAALAMIVLVLTPLYRLGRPPCLTPLPTAHWLLARPGAANCQDCHASAVARASGIGESGWRLHDARWAMAGGR
jgi:hypothetical protein